MLVACSLLYTLLDVRLVDEGEQSAVEEDAPKSHTVVVWANDGSQAAYTVRIGNALHDVEMQFPFIVRGEFLAVAGFDKVHNNIVVFEGLGEAKGCLFVLALVEDADLVVDCRIGSCTVRAGGL